MLASSWKAKGLLQPIWSRLDVPTYKREKLSELTGIPVSNLSSMNTGRMPMTLEMAQRIVRAVPGVTLADLGAPEAVVAQHEPLVLARLEQVEADIRLLRSMIQRLGKIAGEDLPELQDDEDPPQAQPNSEP